MSEELKLTAKQFKEMTSQIIETITRTIDAKDPYTKGHSKRVAHYSGLIGERLGLSDEELMFLRYAALLHDIVKIGIPDAILQKPEQLTPQEYEQIKQHTHIGAEILKGAPLLQGAVVGAKYHHEKWDGTGYLEGLSGEDIPLFARIIGVADTYDTMITDRPYHKAESKKVAMKEIERCGGTQFDPAIAKIMIEIMEEEMSGN